MKTFDALFREATGYRPYGYQARIARDGLPDVVQAPTGAGKTGVILAWLWRRLYGPDPAGTPRRLIYALPQGSLTEQVSGQARQWLANLGLTDEVTLHVAMGARWETEGEWRDDPHKPAIVIGTADVLVSAALVRSFAVSRAIAPIDFALVTNGAHWLIDEPQLSPQATTTMRQLAGFAASTGTAEPFGLTCLSATPPAELISTPGNPATEKPIQILYPERSEALAIRPAPLRAVRRLPADPGDYQAIAAAVLERHRPGALTLVVTNTVDAAQRLYRQLRADFGNCTLLHARFRGIERAERLAAVLGEPGEHGGRIVVATQVVEAGLDLDATVLVTEAAPWPSLIQRAGRGNRDGELNADAELWWLPPPDPFPYQQEDIDATARELSRLEGERLTTEDLTERDVPRRHGQLTVIRQPDLAGLFDTAPDPSGNDVDIAPYLRDAEDLDVEVAWATWTPGADGAPDPEIRVPAVEYRCRVPIGDVVALVAGPRRLAVRPVGGRLDPGHRAAALPARPGRGAAGQRRRRWLRRGNRLRSVGARPGAGQPRAADTRGVAGARSPSRPPRRRSRPALSWPPTLRWRSAGRPPTLRSQPRLWLTPRTTPTRPSPGAGNRSTSTASRSATRPPRCSPSSPRASRPRPPAAPSSPPTCTTLARRTRSGRTRSAP